MYDCTMIAVMPQSVTPTAILLTRTVFYVNAHAISEHMYINP